jgi:hypothetical protein
MPSSRLSTRGRLATAAASLALLSLAAEPLQAQRCLGFPGFANQPMRLTGTLGTGDNVTTLGADLAFGQSAGAFGSVGVGVADYDGNSDDDSALLLSGTIGTQIPLGATATATSGAQVCPFATLDYRVGPGDDVNGLGIRGGAALGTSVTMAPSVRLAPFGAVSIGYVRASAGNFDDSEVGGIIDLGAGVIFNDKFTIRPAVSIPVGFDGSDSSFGVSVGFNFGGNRR